MLKNNLDKKVFKLLFSYLKVITFPLYFPYWLSCNWRRIPLFYRLKDKLVEWYETSKNLIKLLFLLSIPFLDDLIFYLALGIGVIWLSYSFSFTPLVIVALFIMIFPVIRFLYNLIEHYVRHIYYEHLKVNSFCFITMELAFIISFFGKIRKGKDLTMVIIGRMFAVFTQNKLDKRQKEIILRLHFIDFSKIDLHIYYTYEKSIPLSEFTDICLKEFNYYNQVNEKYYKKGNETIYYIDLFIEYIENFYILNMRDNYIWSNSPVVDINGKLAKKFKYEYLQLKQTVEFPNEKHTVGLITEINMNAPAYDYDTPSKRDQHDDGVTEHLVSFGQIYKESTRLLVTQQVVDKWAKPHRQQVNNFVRVLAFELVRTYGKTRNKYQKMIERLDKIQEFFGLFIEGYEKRPNMFRKYANFLDKNAEKLFYKGKFKIRLNIYFNEKDVDVDLRNGIKANNDYIGVAHDLYDDILNGFGMYNTHFLHSLYSEKKSSTNLHFEDLENFDSMFMSTDEIYEVGSESVKNLIHSFNKKQKKTSILDETSDVIDKFY